MNNSESCSIDYWPNSLKVPLSSTLAFRRELAPFIEIPSNHESASFGVHVEDGLDLVDYSFGRIATWELPYEGRNRRPSAGQLLLEVEQMSKAVIAGKCEETRKLFYVTSRIYVDGHTYTMVNMPMLPIPPFGTRKYAPFLCGPN